MSILLRLGGSAEASTPRVMDCGVSRKPRHGHSTWIHSIILPILASTLVASMPFTQAQASIGPLAEPPTYRHASSIRLPAAPVETKPPQALDWRVPAIPAVIPASVEGFPLFYRQAIDKPFAQYDWPVTRRVPSTPRLDYPRLPAAPVESPPFKQLAWPVSLIPLEPPAPTGSLNLPLYSFVQVDRPFVQTEWPLPATPPRYDHPVTDQAVPIFAREVIVVPRPFVQTEWPLSPLPAPLTPRSDVWLVGLYSEPEPPLIVVASIYIPTFRPRRR